MPWSSIAAWRFWRKSSWMNSNLKNVYGMVGLHKDNRTLAIQLARHQLIRNYMFCTRCPGMRRMLLYAAERNTDGYCWRCPQCGKYSSIRKGSFFKNTKINLLNCLWLIRQWANRMTVKGSSKELGLTEKTVVDFRKRIRKACFSVSDVLAYNQTRCRKTGCLIFDLEEW